MIPAIVWLRSKRLLETNEYSVWHHLQHDRRVARMRIPARKTADRPARKHVGLPVSLCLDATNADVKRHQSQRVNRRVVFAVFEDVRGDDCGSGRGLAAREAVIGFTLEPAIAESLTLFCRVVLTLDLVTSQASLFDRQ